MSKKDIDFESLEEWARVGGVLLPSGTVRPKQDECYHEWKKYIGLREMFEFCTRCDLKRPIQDEN